MRGEVQESQNNDYFVGITPAHAGRSASNMNICIKSQDHPRACGEKKWGLNPWDGTPGSPPRMRGEDRRKLTKVVMMRITPAHAGRSLIWICRDVKEWDHPRACGEKQIEKEPPAKGTGSPPRMRGEAKCSSIKAKSKGITPAHAGRSSPHVNSGQAT